MDFGSKCCDITKRPKVALFIPILVTGGSERQLIELAKGLNKLKWDVFVLTMYRGGELFKETESINNVNLVTLNKKNPLLFAWQLRKIIRKEKVDILYCFLSTTQFYSFFEKTLFSNVKLIWRIGDAIDYREYFNAKSALVNFTMRKSFNKTDFYIFNSQAGIKAKSLSMVPADRLRVIHNGIDALKFQPLKSLGEKLKREIGVSSDTLLVGSLGNISIYKDFMTFIEAAKLIQAIIKNTHFVIIGDYNNPLGIKIRGHVKIAEMNSFISFLGSRKDVEKLLPAFDIGCSSSFTEGFSNAICEFMSCGVPCVVTDVGDSSTIVSDTGITVPKSDPQALANGLIKLLKLSPEDRTALGQKARKHIVDNYSISRMIEATEDIFMNVLNYRI